jgi:ABC-2 type transport system permease protein
MRRDTEGPGARLRLNLRAAFGRAYVRVAGSLREPSWAISEILLPVFAMFAYVFVYRGLGAPRVYESFAVLGGLMLAFWLAVLWSMAAQFYWEKQMGNLELYLMAPCSRFAILAGMALGGLVWTSSRALLAFALGIWVLHVPFDASRWPEAMAVFALALIALYALGMWLASLFLLYGREVWHLGNAFQEPVFLSSGLYFPLSALGPWAVVGAAVLPLTLGLDAVRQLVLGPAARGLLPVHVEVALLGACVAVFLVVAAASWRWVEERAKREGRLTLRWQ